MLGSLGNKILSVILIVIFVSVVTVTIYESNVSVSTSLSTSQFPIKANLSYTAEISGATMIQYNFTALETVNSLYIFDYSNVTNGTVSVNATAFNATQYPGNYMKIDVVNGTQVTLDLYVSEAAFHNMHYFNNSLSSMTIVKIIMFTASGNYAYAGFAIAKI